MYVATCVLVGGIPASGKTVMAERLSQLLDLPVISKDAVKELLFDSLGFRSRAEKVALGIASMDIVCYVAEQMLKRGKPFILENNFETATRDQLVDLLSRYGCRPVTVFLTGDVETIYRRFLERDRSPERHRGHVVNTCYPEPEGKRAERVPQTLEQFAAGFQSRGMADFDVGGPRITVDSTDFSKVDYEETARRVKAALSGLWE